MTQWKFVLGTFCTHIYPLCSLFLYIWDDTKYKIQYPFDSKAYRRVKRNVTNWKTHAQTHRHKKSTTAAAATRRTCDGPWKKSINVLLMENLRTKTEVTSHKARTIWFTRCSLKLYALDLFGNVINLLHLYARRAVAARERLCTVAS